MDADLQVNSADRKRIINDVINEINAKEATVAELRAEIRRVKQTRIKGDLGMKIGDFNAALRLSKLEADDRDEFLDTLRETFLAQGVGFQTNWVDQAEAAA